MEEFICAFLQVIAPSSNNNRQDKEEGSTATPTPTPTPISTPAAPPSTSTPTTTLRKAAVLLPLFEQDGKVRCLLTVRPSFMRSHASEVCLPGGKVDESDEDVVAAALREAEEEIGLPQEDVRVLGTMAPTLSLHLLEVHPVVAVIPSNFIPQPNPEEVAEVFSIPLEHILSPPSGTHTFQDLHWFLPWRMHTFRYQDQYDVWGLTAETILRLCLLAFPDHNFPFDARHPDGEAMESWFPRVIALPSFEAEAAAGRRRKAATSGSGGGRGGRRKKS